MVTARLDVLFVFAFIRKIRILSLKYHHVVLDRLINKPQHFSTNIKITRFFIFVNLTYILSQTHKLWQQSQHRQNKVVEQMQ